MFFFRARLSLHSQVRSLGLISSTTGNESAEQKKKDCPHPEHSGLSGHGARCGRGKVKVDGASLPCIHTEHNAF